jgi:hypothetical protein
LERFIQIVAGHPLLQVRDPSPASAQFTDVRFIYRPDQRSCVRSSKIQVGQRTAISSLLPLPRNLLAPRRLYSFLPLLSDVTVVVPLP